MPINFCSVLSTVAVNGLMHTHFIAMCDITTLSANHWKAVAVDSIRRAVCRLRDQDHIQMCCEWWPCWLSGSQRRATSSVFPVNMHAAARPAHSQNDRGQADRWGDEGYAIMPLQRSATAASSCGCIDHLSSFNQAVIHSLTTHIGIG